MIIRDEQHAYNIDNIEPLRKCVQFKGRSFQDLLCTLYFVDEHGSGAILWMLYVGGRPRDMFHF